MSQPSECDCLSDLPRFVVDMQVNILTLSSSFLHKCVYCFVKWQLYIIYIYSV